MHMKPLEQMNIQSILEKVKLPSTIDYNSECDVGDESVISFDYKSFGINHHQHSPSKTRDISNPIDEMEEEKQQEENKYGYNVSHNGGNPDADRNSSHRRHDRFIRTRRGSTGSVSSYNSLMKAPKSLPANHITDTYGYGYGYEDPSPRRSNGNGGEKPKSSRRMSNERTERSERTERITRRRGSNEPDSSPPKRTNTLEKRSHRQRRRNSLDNCSVDSMNKIKSQDRDRIRHNRNRAPRRGSLEGRAITDRKSKPGVSTYENVPRRRNSLERNYVYGSTGEKIHHQRRNSAGRTTSRRGSNERNSPRMIDENETSGRSRNSNSRQAIGNIGERTNSGKSRNSTGSGSSNNSPKHNRMKLNNGSIDSTNHANAEARHSSNDGRDLRFDRGMGQENGYKRSSTRKLVDHCNRGGGNNGSERPLSFAERDLIASPRTRMKATLRSSRKNSEINLDSERNLQSRNVGRKQTNDDNSSFSSQRNVDGSNSGGFGVGKHSNGSQQHSNQSPHSHKALIFPGRNIRRRSAPDIRINHKDLLKRKKSQRPSAIRQSANYYEQNKLLQDVHSLKSSMGIDDEGLNSEEEDERIRSHIFSEYQVEGNVILDRNRDATWVRRRRMRGTTGVSRRLSQ